MKHTLWILSLLVIVAVTLTLWPRKEDSLPPDAAPATPAVKTETTGQALIGGAFTLTDQQGRAVTEEQLKGQHALVFFGFTHCPDICPTALATITQTLQSMGEAGDKVTPVFITVDPKRDTVERLKEYMADFHPRIIALTGTEEQVDGASKAYKVYHQTVGDTAGDDYMVNHSGFIYLMDPEGRYLTHFAYNVGPAELAEKLNQAMQED